jgi:DNA polymerase, archaea type
MKISFYPYDFDYKISGEKVFVHLYGKLEDGTKICVIHKHEPYFFVSIKGIDVKQFEQKIKNINLENNGQMLKITKWVLVEKELLGKKEQFWKLYVNVPMAVLPLAKHLQELEINCYEKDIPFIHRYLRDMEITPLTLVEAEGKFKSDKIFRVPVFQADKLKSVSKKACDKWKILSIDIETYAETRIMDPKKNPILMVAFYGEDEENKPFKKVLTWKKFKHDLDYLEFVSDESELLQRFKEIILEYNSDILTGYFTDGFDLPYIKIRADKYKIKLDLGTNRSELITTKSFREGEAKISGFMHIDIFKFIRRIFGMNLKTDSYSLDAVSKELLGHQKHDVDLNQLSNIWDNEPEKLIPFCEYNLQDSYLAFQLCYNLLPDMTEFTKIVGLPTADVSRMSFSRLVENYILRRATEFNVIAPNKPGNYELGQRMEERIQGAFVKEPIPGLYDDLVVFDFRSLYPTIIISHNIGPESFRCECCKEHKVPEREEYWFCQKDKKFIPTVLEEIILRRIDIKSVIKEAKEKGKGTSFLEARSYALKILANSFYGYLGFFGARWYCLECAASTTAYARNYIKDTIKKAEDKGFQVVYADTDSCFLLLGEKIIDQAMEFMNEVNFDLPGHMELEFEGKYSKGIFVAIKGSDKGAKKKYALLSKDAKLSITGFETVRRNWSKISKEVQEHVLKLVLQDKKNEAIAYARDIAKKLKQGKIPLEKVIIKTQITKELSRYSSIGPHVAVAQKMVENGFPVEPGMVVEYVIAKGSGLVRDRAKLAEEVNEGDYDANYYLNHQIIPVLSSIFQVLGYSEDEIFSESSQKGLGAFF